MIEHGYHNITISSIQSDVYNQEIIIINRHNLYFTHRFSCMTFPFIPTIQADLKTDVNHELITYIQAVIFYKWHYYENIHDVMTSITPLYIKNIEISSVYIIYWNEAHSFIVLKNINMRYQK